MLDKRDAADNQQDNFAKLAFEDADNVLKLYHC